MGGELPETPNADAPAFAVWALRDPGVARFPGTKLERVQIVKGWVEDGASREAVIEVAAAPERGDARSETEDSPRPRRFVASAGASSGFQPP